jgi:hypothetical protein
LKRIAVPLICVMLAYFAYAYTLPPAPVEDARASADQSARATLRIELPAVRLYFACFGEYDDPGIARVEAARHATKGSAAFVRAEGDTHWIFASAYENEGDARSVCERIARYEGIAATVQTRTAEAIAVRVTATQRQLGALSAAVSAIGNYPKELNALSYRIDGGELDSRTARALIEIALTEVTAIERELRIALAETDDRFALGVYNLALSMRDHVERIAGDEELKGLQLSSALKHHYIQTQLSVMDFMLGLE